MWCGNVGCHPNELTSRRNLEERVAMSRVLLRSVCGIRPKCGSQSRPGVRSNSAMTTTIAESSPGEGAVAKYPPIEELSRDARSHRTRIEWEEQVKSVKTIEEKLIKINMPRFYGFKCSILKNGEYPIQTLEHFQQITKTQMIVQDSLPEFYLPLSSAAEYHAQRLRPKIEEAIFAEYQGIKRNFTYDKDVSIKRQNDKFISKSFLKQVNRILMNYLSNNIPHLMETHIDVEPRFESFWVVGGLHSPKSVVYNRLKLRWMSKEEKLAPIDRYYQTLSTPVLTLRNKHPLDPILTDSEVRGMKYNVPYNRYAPEVLGIKTQYRHGTCIPGFWPGNKHEFGSIAYYTRDYFVDLSDNLPMEEKVDILHSDGILSSFGWLNSLACYQGFSTYNDLTYPLCTQTIISNGQFWSFYTYQLNTMTMSGHHIDEENVQNICYATNPMKLFDGIGEDGKVVGFNEGVLKILLQYYLNPPKERENLELKPYLHPKIINIANIFGEEKSTWLENRFKHLFSNKPRNRLPYEIYDWERIYKIKFQTRFRDARRRPFELRQNPLNRRLDDHMAKYVPKALRVGSYVNRKYRRTYYP